MGSKNRRQLKTVSVRANFPQTIVQMTPDHSPERLLLVQEYREQRENCDFTIIVGEKRILAHRIVLAPSIPYFESMIQFMDIANGNKKKSWEITMQDVDLSALVSLIDYVYTGEVEVNDDNVQALITSADFLQVNQVRDMFAEYLVVSLNVDNVLGIRRLAKLISNDEVVIEADLLIHSKFVNVVESSEFLDLEISELLDILSSNNLNVSSEKTIFEACLRWIKHEVESRTALLSQVLKVCRHTLIPPEFIQKQTEQEDILKESSDARSLLENRDVQHVSRKHMFVGNIYILKSSMKRDEKLLTNVVYNPRKKEFRKAMAMSTERQLFGVAAYDGQLYTFGGYCGDEHLSTVEVYSPKEDSWSSLEPMQTKRWFVGAATYNDRIYVCGGYDCSEVFKTVECYCPKTNTWTFVAPMLEAHNIFHVVALGNYLYAVGGSITSSKNVQKYDPAADVWTMTTPMQLGRFGPGVTTFDGKLYVAGGYKNGETNTVEVFDPESEVWTYLKPMNKARDRFSLVTSIGQLFAVGGDLENSIEVYDPATDEWTILDDGAMVDFVGVASVAVSI